ncbi:hypothetical protein [Kitasatospora sp. NPDC007106]|uniref:hypothetical protein n=1 Tax=Kitasatospora sp. NPDC007106 TaxID=3156914 RepID=UPI0033F965AA
MSEQHACTCGHDHSPALQQPMYPAPYPVYPQPPAPVPARPYGGYIAAGAGAAAVLIPTLLAVTAALLAVGLAALAIAVTALVCRWIAKDMRRG